jgi:hypothetical protein
MKQAGAKQAVWRHKHPRNKENNYEGNKDDHLWAIQLWQIRSVENLEAEAEVAEAAENKQSQLPGFPELKSVNIPESTTIITRAVAASLYIVSSTMR